MTVPMSVQESIRALDAQGVAGREIARSLGVSRDSVGQAAFQAFLGLQSERQPSTYRSIIPAGPAAQHSAELTG